VHGLPPTRRDGALTASLAPAAARGRTFLLAAVAFVVVVLDQFTKELVLAVLIPGRLVPMFGTSVGWQLVFNPGAAFGLPLPPVVFPLVTVVLVVYVLRAVRDPGPPGAVVALGLLVGGAIGNVVDRIVRAGDDVLFGGHVVDFVAWGSFPRFNVADASITVGVAVFMLVTFVDSLTERRRAAERS